MQGLEGGVLHLEGGVLHLKGGVPHLCVGGLVSVQGVSQQRGEVLRLYEGLRSLRKGQHPFEGSHVCTRGPTSERRGVVLIRSFIKSAWGGGVSTGSVGTSVWGCRIHPRGVLSSILGVSPPSRGSPLHPGGVPLVPHHLSPPCRTARSSPTWSRPSRPSSTSSTATP